MIKCSCKERSMEKLLALSCSHQQSSYSPFQSNQMWAYKLRSKGERSTFINKSLTSLAHTSLNCITREIIIYTTRWMSFSYLVKLYRRRSVCELQLNECFPHRFTGHHITPQRQVSIWEKFTSDPNPCMDFWALVAPTAERVFKDWCLWFWALKVSMLVPFLRQRHYENVI